jgi:hypothetical protein
MWCVDRLVTFRAALNLWGVAQSRIMIPQSTLVENDHTSSEIWVGQDMTLEFDGAVDLSRAESSF